MQEKYQCHICMEVANRPVVTPCGHLFCWSCIYFWLRSNQQYLTCPICKSGLEMSSLRSLITPYDGPQKLENGIPPRPKPFLKQKPNINKVRSLPKCIASVGMNLQKGVLLVGYGLLPSLILSLHNYSKQPQKEDNPFGQYLQEYKIYKCMQIVRITMIAIVIIIVLGLLFL